MRKLALVFTGGFCGTLARYFLASPLLLLAARIFPDGPAHFPYDIFAINLTGAFTLGLLYGLAERGSAISPEARLALGTGFLGAYTTFSTFTYGGNMLLGGDHWLFGLLYLGGGLALGIVCVHLGQVAAEMVAQRRHIGQRVRRARRVWRRVLPASGSLALRRGRLARYASAHAGATHPSRLPSHSGMHRAVRQRGKLHTQQHGQGHEAELTSEEELL